MADNDLQDLQALRDMRSEWLSLQLETFRYLRNKTPATVPPEILAPDGTKYKYEDALKKAAEMVPLLTEQIKALEAVTLDKSQGQRTIFGQRIKI